MSDEKKLTEEEALNEKMKNELRNEFIRLNEKLFELEDFKLARREVLYAILVGIFANIFTSYLITFDIILFGGSMDGLSIRVIITGLVLAYFVCFYNNLKNQIERKIEPAKQIYLSLLNGLLKKNPEILNEIIEKKPEYSEFIEEYKKDINLE